MTPQSELHESRGTSPKPVVGLAGGIGSGKTTAARILAESGGRVISSDDINRAELNSPDVAETVSQWWGPSVIGSNGLLDRRRISEIVFADDSKRHRLEQLLHPRVARERIRQMDTARADRSVRFIVCDSPLLFEAGLNADCDCVVFVDADVETRRQRVATTRGWPADELDRREKTQQPLDRKRSLADYVIENNSDEPSLRRQIESIVSKVLAGAS